MNTTGLEAVLIILGLNGFVVLVLLLLALFQKKGNKSTYFLLAWFVLLVPFIGGLFIVFGMLISFSQRKKNIDMSEVRFSHDYDKLVLPPDQEIEMNYVPIQDAMAVSDIESLRRLLLDTLRNNAKKTVASIAVALNSKDTEASHYVATIIMDALSEFRSTAQSMIDEVEKLPEDVEMNLLTLEYIHEVLSMKIMTEVEQESYIYTLNNIAELLFTQNLWYMTATHYLWMTDLFISIKDYNMAELWVSRAGKYRPDELDTYKAKLHFYFEQHNQSEFYHCLRELRSKDITIDEEIINLIRLYGV